MITAQEAYRNLLMSLDGIMVIAGYEYDSCFVFNAVPKEYVDTKKQDELLDAAYSVDKRNGKVGRFNPLLMSIDEYKRGGRIPIFDR